MGINSDTIYALATPIGVSGVAIIRISGPEAHWILSQLVADELVSKLRPRAATIHRLYDPQSGELIDEGLILWFPAPASFTGEDVIELQVHGSRAVIDKLSDVLANLGCRPANAGEFSRRSLDNGKLDLISVEALDGLIHANDPATLALAHGQAGKARQKIFDGWRSTLTRLLASCEALIDFPEDDLPPELIDENKLELESIRQAVAKLAERSELAQSLHQGLEILLAGPPNSGKSTLLNALAGYERAIVSEEPGTTRDFVELEMSMGRFHVRFVDTAGLRETQISVENKGIQRTRERFTTASLILNLHEPNQTIEEIEATCPVWNVQTKGVVQSVRSIAAGESKYPGVDDLLKEIQDWLDHTYGHVLESLSFHRERQVFHVKQILEFLDQARQDEPFPELQAEHLRQAAQALGFLSGAIHVEDVLDELFRGFCIGK